MYYIGLRTYSLRYRNTKYGDRQAIASEVEQLFDNVLQLYNSTHGGKYLFAGQKIPQSLMYAIETIRGSEYFTIIYQGGFKDDAQDRFYECSD